MFVNAANVVPRRGIESRSGPRFSRILRAEQVAFDPTPVSSAPVHEKIRIIPIMEQGRIKALRAICACGNESVYDIDYTESGEVL